MVLGIATTTECTPYITSFLKYNQTNNIEDVRRLQTFLNEQGLGKPPITGYFDSNTTAAVKTFQQQYKDNILIPWGLSEPTGYVYYTTQKTINEIKCANEKIFPLTASQAIEIERYKKYSTQKTVGASIPITPAVIPTITTPIVPPKPTPVQVATPPPLTFDKIEIAAEPADQTASSFHKTLTNLLQTSVRSFSRLKFW